MGLTLLFSQHVNRNNNFTRCIIERHDRAGALTF